MRICFPESTQTLLVLYKKSIRGSCVDVKRSLSMVESSSGKNGEALLLIHTWRVSRCRATQCGGFVQGEVEEGHDKREVVAKHNVETGT